MGLTKYTTAAALVPEPGAVEDDMAIGIAEIPAVLFRLTRNQKECIIVLVYRVAGKTVAIMETALFSTTYKFMCSVLVCFSSIPKGKAIPLQACLEALRVPGRSGSQISRQSANEGGKVVSPTHRPPLPLGNISGTHFC